MKHNHSVQDMVTRGTVSKPKFLLGLICLVCSAFSSIGFAVEVVNDSVRARRFLNADLVIVGNTLSCTTWVIEEKDTPADSGWTDHYDIWLKSCIVQIDSVLRGTYSDATITVLSKEYQRYRERFVSADEKGDSLFMFEAWGNNGDSNPMNESKKYIILLRKEKTKHMCNSFIFYKQSDVDFYTDVEREGENVFKDSFLLKRRTKGE